jgi:hypothetical protein
MSSQNQIEGNYNTNAEQYNQQPPPSYNQNPHEYRPYGGPVYNTYEIPAQPIQSVQENPGCITKIVDSMKTVHIKKGYECAFVTFCIIFVVCAAIFLGIFFGVNKKDIDYKYPYLATTCQTLQNIVTKTPCCDITNCQCSEATYGAPSCSAAKNTFVSAPVCGNGYYCCRSACDTCYRTESYSCNCNIVHGVNICSTCYRTVSYDCNCGCKQSVNNELCSVQCGTCYSIQTIYGYNTTVGFQSSVDTQSCGRDDVVCYNSWIGSHPTGQTSECWYNSNNPSGGADYSKPVYHNNVAAIVFACIFGSVAVLMLIGAIALFRCYCK